MHMVDSPNIMKHLLPINFSYDYMYVRTYLHSKRLLIHYINEILSAMKEGELSAIYSLLLLFPLRYHNLR